MAIITATGQQTEHTEQPLSTAASELTQAQAKQTRSEHAGVVFAAAAFAL